MSGAEDSESPQVKLMHEWGQGFVKMDVNLVAKHLHDDYRHIRYPQSLGMLDQNKDEYLQHMAKVMSIWTENEVSYQSLSKFISRYIPSVVDRPFNHRRLREGCRSRP